MEVPYWSPMSLIDKGIKECLPSEKQTASFCILNHHFTAFALYSLSNFNQRITSRFWIQPESGLPLDVSAKFQINMALDDLSSITNSGRFANLYLPLLWFDIVSVILSVFVIISHVVKKRSNIFI